MTLDSSRDVMRIAIIATYRHPTRLDIKEKSVMQSGVPELLAGLCPFDAEIEIYNEKEIDIPFDKYWDLVFFSYLHSYYEHTKVLSTVFRRKGMKTVAGGRHASYFYEDCLKYFDCVLIGEPEWAVPQVVRDFEAGKLARVYRSPPVNFADIKPYRYDLINFGGNPLRVPGIEASRGCPFQCNFCVLANRERYRCRPIENVIMDIKFRMRFNRSYFGLGNRCFVFLDNNIGGSPKYLRELSEALIPLRVKWGCALSLNLLNDESLVKLLHRAGCRYIYSGLES